MRIFRFQNDRSLFPKKAYKNSEKGERYGKIAIRAVIVAASSQNVDEVKMNFIFPNIPVSVSHLSAKRSL